MAQSLLPLTLLGAGVWHHCLSPFFLSGPLVKMEEPRPREPRGEGGPLAWVGQEGGLEASEPWREEGCRRRGREGFSSFTFQPKQQANASKCVNEATNSSPQVS